MSRIRVLPVLVVMSLTVSLLFGGWELYRNFGLVRPLEQQLMADKAVTQVESVVNGSERAIKIHLKPVDDLQSTYDNLEQIVQKQIGPDVQIELVDQRQDALNRAYRSVQPVLYSGIAKGDFTNMIAQTEQELKAQGYQSKVSLNDHNIFVQIEKDGKYLYQVLPYGTATAYSQLLKGGVAL